MDEIEPLTDAMLAVMEAQAVAHRNRYPGYEGGEVVRVGWDQFHSLITEVRRLRAERVAVHVEYCDICDEEAPSVEIIIRTIATAYEQRYTVCSGCGLHVQNMIEDYQNQLTEEADSLRRATPPDQQAAGPEQRPDPRQGPREYADIYIPAIDDPKQGQGGTA